MEVAARRDRGHSNRTLLVNMKRTSSSANDGVIAGVVVKADEFVVVVTDVVSTISVKDKTIVVSTVAYLVQDVVREPECSEVECAGAAVVFIDHDSVGISL